MENNNHNLPLVREIALKLKLSNIAAILANRYYALLAPFSL